MTANEDLAAFIRRSFSSIWSLDLLLLLRGDAERDWTREELINALRASEQVLARSIGDLAAAELVRVETGTVRFAPASPDLKTCVDEVALLYARRPAQMRRLIVSGGGDDQLAGFASAFRLRGDH